MMRSFVDDACQRGRVVQEFDASFREALAGQQVLDADNRAAQNRVWPILLYAHLGHRLIEGYILRLSCQPRLGGACEYELGRCSGAGV